MLRTTVDSRDLDAQVRKLADFDDVAAQEFSRAMGAALRLGVTDTTARAPVGSGALAGSITGEIRFVRADEVRGVMTADARGANGFPYGYAQDVSDRYHYRGRRRKTKNWFKGFLRRKRREVNQLFSDAVPRILARLEVKGTHGDQ